MLIMRMNNKRKGWMIKGWDKRNNAAPPPSPFGHTMSNIYCIGLKIGHTMFYTVLHQFEPFCCSVLWCIYWSHYVRPTALHCLLLHCLLLHSTAPMYWLVTVGPFNPWIETDADVRAGTKATKASIEYRIAWPVRQPKRWNNAMVATHRWSLEGTKLPS